MTHFKDDFDDEDSCEANIGETPFRVVVCMLREASRQLLQAQYLQSDIAFKRVVGFQEFELGSMHLAS